MKKCAIKLVLLFGGMHARGEGDMHKFFCSIKHAEIQQAQKRDYVDDHASMPVAGAAAPARPNVPPPLVLPQWLRSRP
jgi:hypothetical protein